MRGGSSLMDELPYILGNDMVRDQPVLLTVPERRQHVSIVGRTGSGKTTLMFGMLVNDLAAGRGFVFIDPHGDTARRLADTVPKDRVRNVIYFQPADPDYAMSWNPLIPTDPLLRWTTAASIVEIFRTIWKNTWGARLDYILTQAITLLLQKPGSTLTDLPRLLTDQRFRQKFLDKSDDEHLVRYWRDRFDALSPRLRDETLSPVDNKIGQFVGNPLLRDVIGHRSSFSMETVLKDGKGLIVDLSGMGEEPSRILGALIVSSVWQAAEKREAIPEEDRTDFGLYVDEFQRYITPTFARILSESRKYRLAFVLASQYLDQADETVRSALFGNVGTSIVFRVGVLDAPLLAKELHTAERVLLDQANHQATVRLLSGGSPSDAIRIKTILPSCSSGALEKVRSHTRSNYARRRS